MEYGVVAWYNHRRGVGRIALHGTNETVLFEWRHGRFMSNDGTGPVFGPQREVVTTKTQQRKPLKPPSPGDEVVFERRMTDKGPEAWRWAYRDSLLAVMKRLQRRPWYRLVRYEMDDNGQPVNSRHLGVVWIGQDVMALSVKHPVYPLDDGTMYGNSRHRDVVEIRGVSHVWVVEQLTSKGRWLQCSREPRYWLCCIPAEVFQKHKYAGQVQPECQHERAA